MFLTYFWDWTIITADFNFIAKCFQLFLQVIFPFLLHPLVEIFRTEFLILTASFSTCHTDFRIECPTATKALFFPRRAAKR